MGATKYDRSPCVLRCLVCESHQVGRRRRWDHCVGFLRPSLAGGKSIGLAIPSDYQITAVLIEFLNRPFRRGRRIWCLDKADEFDGLSP